MEIITITDATLDLAKEWYAKAINSSIYKYLGDASYLSHNFNMEYDGWNGLVFIDSDKICLGHLSINRAHSPAEGSICVWKLPSETKNLVAVNMARFIIKQAINRNLLFLNSKVSASNIVSLETTRKLLGPEYGIEPYGFFNIESGKFEHLHEFRLCLNKEILKAYL